MLTQKVDKKKNLIYGIVFAIILIIVAVLLFKKYIFTGSFENEESIEQNINYEAIYEPVEKFDYRFLNDSHYKKLKDNSVKTRDIEDLKIGKDNPFMID